MKKLLIITDYNHRFLISLDNDDKYVSMNVSKLHRIFSKYGLDVEVKEFSQIDMNIDYHGYIVLYQTSEGNGQFYKKYIEDLIYQLQSNGAVVLPKYQYLKAHHNKGSMEQIRCGFNDRSLKSITSKYYGTPIEALKASPEFPVVIKQISGSGSTGVYRASNLKEYKKYVYEASKTLIAKNILDLFITRTKMVIKGFLSLLNPKYFYRKERIYRPFIVQNFIQNLSGDFKVLYFGGKYYTLYRENRKNDFRASGGGRLFEVPLEENYPLLDFARKVVDEIDFPIIGMDIGYDGKQFHLIEFQMIHLGPYALQRSNRYFLWKNNSWECIQTKSDLEEEFARSISEYIENRN